ncbi:ABC transporter ATP-binding protein [Nocardia terpenica]|uniref:ATP-binding cassette domain-containing protein n=1 Tax=Nocardia terpenica TaxID=455432 RepID=A0A6G9YWG7_9NOCA|nr:ATP-binding cassette domain-containing protein [Nocardia terpenica]QIS17542.1 ATP-binding cassette domain-containing protein [Nocardia terpenica]
MIVDMHGIGKRFGRVQALTDITLSVAPGTVYGLLGPNGAGKTTTLSVLLGLLRPDRGTVRLFGNDWERGALARVGASVDGPSCYGHLTARQNLRVHAHLIGADDAAIDRALAQAGLTGVADRRASGYSTGMRTRLATAIALLGDPELVVLDEPQNGLDPAGIREMRELMRRIAEAGRTVLFSSHVLAEVAATADHIGCIAAGRTVFQGTLADFAPDGDIERAYFALCGVMA